MNESEPNAPNAPQSIYPYLKINQKDQNIYTKEYFQGLEIDIYHANPIVTISQKGGGEPPISGPYKYFNYFFNNIRSSKKTATPTAPAPTAPAPTAPAPTAPAPIAPAPTAPAPTAIETPVTQALLATEEHPTPPHEIFIFIKNSYTQPKKIDTTILDINDIEHLAKTLTLQIKIHEKNGRNFSVIHEQDILSVNNQFIFFPSLSQQQQQKSSSVATSASASALGNFLLELLKKSSLSLENTKLTYFIKRAIEEKVILWV